MPNKLESELRAVQTSIADIKKQMNETESADRYERMQEILELYYKEEERLLNEINRG